MNILIVEDCPILQIINQELMNDWGYHFDMASNGKEAIELVQKNDSQYDLCLMDIDMPTMNGIEATRIIRKTSNYFPIMALTSNDHCKTACFAAGMDDFVLKPCQPDELFRKINALLLKTRAC